MARHAFLLGGTGQIGRAVAAALLDRGWTVALASALGGGVVFNHCRDSTLYQ